MNVLLIDGFNLIRRLYEARPHDDRVLDPEVVTSSVQSLQRALRQHQPSHTACVFDSHDRTWRHELYPNYKANRKPTPAPLLAGLAHFEAGFEEKGVKSITIPGFEADDVMATLAHGIDKAGKKVVILSTDKNFFQMLNVNISVFDHFNETEFTRDYIEKKFGVGINKLLDYWSLTGDSSGNIKGVSKIGPKTACKLVNTYGSLDEMLNHPSEDKQLLRVKDHAGDAKLAYQLLKLKTDIRLGVNLNELRYTNQ